MTRIVSRQSQTIAPSLLADAEAVLRAETGRELKRAIAELTGRIAPADLLDALDQTAPRLALMEELFRRVTRINKIRAAALSWRRKTRRRLNEWPGRFHWSIRTVHDHVTLYSKPSDRPDDKTLIIGFTGNANLLMVPTYHILQAIGRHPADLLLLSDVSHSFYTRGLQGIAANPEALGNFLDQFAHDHAYKKVIAMGTSAGGLVSIELALARRWSRAVSVGGDDPRNHPHYEEALNRLALTDHETTLCLCYADLNERDRGAALYIKSLFPYAEMIDERGIDDHNLLEQIDERGDLTEWLHRRLFGHGR